MQKNKILILFLFLTFFILNFNVEAKDFETIYHRNSTIEIHTRARAGTYLRFESKILEAELGESSYFNIDINSAETTIKISPSQKNVATSLYLVTEDGKTYYFRVIEDNSKEGLTVANIKTEPDIDYNHLLEITNNRRINIDPAIRESIKVFDVNQRVYNLNSLNVKVIRSVVNKKDGVIIHWIRYENNTSNPLKLNQESIDIKDENVLAIALESDIQTLSQNDIINFKNNEIIDSYIITEFNGENPSKNLELTMEIDEENKNYSLSNIPYKSQSFRIFERESGEYINTNIQDYKR